MAELLLQLRTALKKVADAEKAPQMQAYMKSVMPYHGVPSPILKKTCKTVFAKLELPDFETWKRQVAKLWREAKFREERYGALHLAADRRARKFQTPDAMELYEELIVTGAWWDYVDDVASHRVGPILAAHPKPLQKQMLAWSKSPDIWKRRTAIICQLGFKNETNLDLLYKCIEPSMESDEFFLRKAIGWALRQVAWHDPNEVVRYVKMNRERLSPLSKREALKNILKSGRIKTIP
jgi:3-methyladenine DNA glycosylase AlkD